MRGKITFLAGAAVGYVVGTRAGRERYDDIVRRIRTALDSPTVHEATGVVQDRATKLYEHGKDSLSNSRLRHPMSHDGHGVDVDDLLADEPPQRMSTNSF